MFTPVMQFKRKRRTYTHTYRRETLLMMGNWRSSLSPLFIMQLSLVREERMQQKRAKSIWGRWTWILLACGWILKVNPWKDVAPVFIPTNHNYEGHLCPHRSSQKRSMYRRLITLNISHSDHQQEAGLRWKQTLKQSATSQHIAPRKTNKLKFWMKFVHRLLMWWEGRWYIHHYNEFRLVEEKQRSLRCMTTFVKNSAFCTSWRHNSRWNSYAVCAIKNLLRHYSSHQRLNLSSTYNTPPGNWPAVSLDIISKYAITVNWYTTAAC